MASGSCGASFVDGPARASKVWNWSTWSVDSRDFSRQMVLLNLAHRQECECCDMDLLNFVEIVCYWTGCLSHRSRPTVWTWQTVYLFHFARWTATSGKDHSSKHVPGRLVSWWLWQSIVPWLRFFWQPGSILGNQTRENPAHQHAGPPSRLAYNQPHHAQENIKQIRLGVDFSLHAWSGMVVKYHHFAHHIDCSNHIETLPVPEGQNAASVSRGVHPNSWGQTSLRQTFANQTWEPDGKCRLPRPHRPHIGLRTWRFRGHLGMDRERRGDIGDIGEHERTRAPWMDKVQPRSVATGCLEKVLSFEAVC